LRASNLSGFTRSLPHRSPPNGARGNKIPLTMDRYPITIRFNVMGLSLTRATGAPLRQGVIAPGKK